MERLTHILVSGMGEDAVQRVKADFKDMGDVLPPEPFPAHLPDPYDCPRVEFALGPHIDPSFGSACGRGARSVKSAFAQLGPERVVLAPGYGIALQRLQGPL